MSAVPALLLAVAAGLLSWVAFRHYFIRGRAALWLTLLFARLIMKSRWSNRRAFSVLMRFIDRHGEPLILRLMVMDSYQGKFSRDRTFFFLLNFLSEIFGSFKTDDEWRAA